MQAAGLVRMQRTLQWLTQYLADSIYPGAPAPRKYLAMRLLQLFLETFPATEWMLPATPPPTSSPQPSTSRFQPYCGILHSQEFIQVWGRSY